ncbi:MAG: Asp23/Gls24 family envelope stress response protein [Clostridia bacterium]|nr:Asp23/Gls24 family envelope stress response protein [Clostridia bacterium]
MAVKINTNRGQVIITNKVIVKTIANVCTSCYGVVGFSNNGRTIKKENIAQLSKGVKIRANQSKLVIDLHIVAAYGVNIQSISESICRNVKYEIQHMMGIEVDKVIVHIDNMVEKE